MTLPTWEEIEAADYPELVIHFWLPVPAKDADERARVRRIAERMAELNPPPARRPHLPIAPQPAPQTEPAATPAPCPPPAPKPKPKPAPSKPPATDLTHFRDLFKR